MHLRLTLCPPRLTMVSHSAVSSFRSQPLPTPERPPGQKVSGPSRACLSSLYKKMNPAAAAKCGSAWGSRCAQCSSSYQLITGRDETNLYLLGLARPTSLKHLQAFYKANSKVDLTTLIAARLLNFCQSPTQRCVSAETSSQQSTFARHSSPTARYLLTFPCFSNIMSSVCGESQRNSVKNDNTAIFEEMNMQICAWAHAWIRARKCVPNFFACERLAVQFGLSLGCKACTGTRYTAYPKACPVHLELPGSCRMAVSILSLLLWCLQKPCSKLSVTARHPKMHCWKSRGSRSPSPGT